MPRAYSYLRMSTQAQLQGDSLRRQDDPSHAYASRMGWELLEEDQLRDIGVSAFKGANATGGALGRFLQAIQNGKVEPGSILLIELLDRLSRQELSKGLTLFLQIINAGVRIVTLADERTYTSESDIADLLFSVVAFSRAHEESRTKSYRVKAAWANKRERVAECKLTARCPGWLKLSEDRRSFRIISERAEVVGQIFEESAAGIGNYSIARRFNRAATPPFGRARGWRTSSIAKILSSRAVLGEFQPCSLTNGKRVPEGNPISGYFPQVISEQLFYRAQNARIQRRTGGGGRRGSGVSNLFSKLARCLYCGSAMMFVNKGSRPKGGTYLVCDSERRGLGCTSSGWRYDHFEASFLAFVEEVDLASLVQSETQALRRRELSNELSALEGRLASCEQQIERTIALCASVEAATEIVSRRVEDLAKQRLELLDLVAKTRREQDHLSSQLTGFYESKEDIKSLIEKLQRSGDADTYKLRSLIASRLQSLVADLVIASHGSGPLVRDRISWLEDHDDLAGAALARKRLEDAAEHLPFFLVSFKHGGAVQAVYPSSNDPFASEERFPISVDQKNGRPSIDN